MSSIEETLFDLLLNALLQIVIFAVIAAVFSRFIKRARAENQYRFYVTLLLFCLAVPIINTFCLPSIVVAERSQEPVFSAAGANASPWIWKRASRQHSQFSVPPSFQHWSLFTWGVFVLFRLVRFSLAAHRVSQLRKTAATLSVAEIGMAGQIFGADRRVALLESAAIDDPLTVGVFHPAILLPSKVMTQLDQRDLSAVLAHEYGHILRKDFLVHFLCQLLALPVTWHPGIRYVMSKISQTRELACDDYAAERCGTRRSYANALLRVASLCLYVPRGNAVALGIFNGNNLETRIMMLTEKTLSLSRAGVVGLALTMTITFGLGAVLMHSISLQGRAEPATTAEKFAGTWHWMFDGRSFATMILVRNGSAFSGSLTESRIALNDDGGLLQADPSDNTTPNPITKARLEGSALHVTVEGGFEFSVTLKDDTHAEIHPAGAPPKMKPIPAEKVH